MKKIGLLLIVILSLFIFSGCDKSDKVESNGTTVSTSNMKHKHCTRQATGGTGIDVNLNYDLYYRGEDLLLLKSVEQVISSSDESLDKYEEAYKSISTHYKGLEYYDQDVVRGDTSVTNTIVINYEKIDINHLLAIEGEEDNIIKNGKAKVDMWITLAKKFGTKCEEVTNG